MATFDLESVISILKNKGYREIVLQFVDNLLPVAVKVQKAIQAALPHAHISITADSTWGSSADDISAQHIKAEVLVFFGSDLSSSSLLPVIVVPEIKPIDLARLERAVFADIAETSTVLVLYEPSFYYAALKVSIGHLFRVHLGKLPAQADLQNSPEPVKDGISVGGLHVSREILNQSNLTVVYIGENESQLQNIVLRLSSIPVLQFCPSTSEVISHLGTKGSELRERYGGIHKVESAKVIGIILGSMGIDKDRTQNLIRRLEKLITAAGKKYYTFVMGRINEAKLCNFPEVDVFCLIANDDVGLVKPRSFHVPVITPYELEVGLKASPWASVLSVGIDELLNTDINQGLDSIQAERGEELGEEPSDQLLSLDCLNPSEQSLVVFESAAAEYFSNRTFKGLLENDSSNDLTIHMGQVGIASKYDNIVDE